MFDCIGMVHCGLPNGANGNGLIPLEVEPINKSNSDFNWWVSHCLDITLGLVKEQKQMKISVGGNQLQQVAFCTSMQQLQQTQLMQTQVMSQLSHQMGARGSTTSKQIHLTSISSISSSIGIPSIPNDLCHISTWSCIDAIVKITNWQELD